MQSNPVRSNGIHITPPLRLYLCGYNLQRPFCKEPSLKSLEPCIPQFFLQISIDKFFGCSMLGEYKKYLLEHACSAFPFMKIKKKNPPAVIFYIRRAWSSQRIYQC